MYQNWDVKLIVKYLLAIGLTAPLYGMTTVVDSKLEKPHQVKKADKELWLHHAAQDGRRGVVQYLLDEGYDINDAGTDGATALHWAAGSGRTAVVKLLLERGANRDALDHISRTPFHCAVLEGHKEVAELLLDKSSGKEVNAATYLGRTALHWAAERGHTEMVEFLLNRGAERDAVDEYGKNALCWALTYDLHKETAALLLKRGAHLGPLSRSWRSFLMGRIIDLVFEKGSEFGTFDEAANTLWSAC